MKFSEFQPINEAPAPAVKTKATKPLPVAATAANTRDFNKTKAHQKKLGVTADGIMGPKTKAAMKTAERDAMTLHHSPGGYTAGLPNAKTITDTSPAAQKFKDDAMNRLTPAQQKKVKNDVKQMEIQRLAPATQAELDALEKAAN